MQRMFFVPSVQKPSVSPPPHSRVSPSGLSETVQGYPAAVRNQALLPWGSKGGRARETQQPELVSPGGWLKGSLCGILYPTACLVLPSGVWLSPLWLWLAGLRCPRTCWHCNWQPTAGWKGREMNSLFLKYLITAIFLNTADPKFFFSVKP